MTSEQLLQRWEVYLQRFREKRFWIIGITGLAFVLMVLYAWSKGTSYQAKTVFHPVQSSGDGAFSQLASFSSLLGGDIFMINGEMKGILASRNLSERVAADSIVYEGKRQTIAEALYTANRKGWSLGKMLSGSKPDTAKLEGKIISIGKHLRSRVKVVESEYGFLEMIYTHPDETIVQYVCESYINNLETYYFDQKTEKARRDLEYYTIQATKSKQKLDSAQAYIAAYQDYQRLGTSASQSLRYVRKQAEVDQYNRLYQQWSLQQAQARAQLQSNTPVVQVLDQPFPPFRREKSSKVVWGIFGIFLGLSFTITWYFWRYILDDVKGYIFRALDD